MNTFKKSLLATAVLAFAGSASAATVGLVYETGGTAGPVTTVVTPNATGSAFIASLEGLNAKTTKELPLVAAAAAAVGTGAADYAALQVSFTTGTIIPVNDVVSVTFTGATPKANGTPSLGASFDLIDIVGSVVRFRVNTQVAASTALALTGVKLEYTTLAADATVSVDYKVISQNSAIGDYDKVSRTVFTAKSQFAATADTVFDATLLTSESRKKFAGTAPATDVAKITATDKAALDNVTAAANDAYIFPVAAGAANDTVVYELKGDFAFLRDLDKTDFGGDANSTLISTEIDNSIAHAFTTAGGGADTVAYSLNTANNVLTVTQTIVGTLDTGLELTVTPPAATGTVTADRTAKATALTNSSYTAGVKWVTAAPKTYAITSGDLNLGKFVYDGSVVRVPFMTVQEGKWSGVVRVSNGSAQTGTIKLDIYDVNGTAIKTGYTAASSSTPNSSVNVYNDILAALKSATVDTVGKLNQISVVVTTEVPENSVQVYSAFTNETTGARFIVNNDGKVQTKTN